MESITHDQYDCIRLGNQVCFPLYACAKEVVRRYREPLEALNLTYTQYIVMMVLWEFGSMTEGELGKKVHLDSGTLAPLLKRLEKQGYIQRIRPENNERTLFLSLTERGEALKEQAKAVPAAMQGCIPLKQEELMQLKALLDQALMPASVALSLGLYFAERAKGPYRNHFIEFSAHPELIELKGETFVEKLRYIASFCEVANTNLTSVFDLILSAAVKNSVPQEDLPQKLYIISDMEFDACVYGANETVFENARKRYAEHGYELPQLVFWNVDSRNRQQPVTMNDLGVALVSGCSPRIFSMAMEGVLDPYAFMLSVLNSERYANICA